VTSEYRWSVTKKETKKEAVAPLVSVVVDAAKPRIVDVGRGSCVENARRRKEERRARGGVRGEDTERGGRSTHSKETIKKHF